MDGALQHSANGIVVRARYPLGSMNTVAEYRLGNNPTLADDTYLLLIPLQSSQFILGQNQVPVGAQFDLYVNNKKLTSAASPIRAIGRGLVTLQNLNVTGPIIPEDPPTPTPTATITPTPTATPPPDLDSDSDGIPDTLEWGPEDGGSRIPDGKTHRYLADSDGDGLLDGVEDANHSGTWNQGSETNPRNRDTDGDGYGDGIEGLVAGGDPLNMAAPAAPYVDADLDGLPAQIDPNEANVDSDGDRYRDGYEAAHVGLPAVQNAQVHPTLGDVNNDGFVDNVDYAIVQGLFAGDLPFNHPAVQNSSNSDADRNSHIDNVDYAIIQGFFNTEPTLQSFPLGVP